MSIADLTAFDLERGVSLDAVCARLAERVENGRNTVLLAGGTDWMVEQEMATPQPTSAERPLIIDISRLEALRGIALVGDKLRIGAATTYLEIERHPDVLARAPMLVRMGKDVGAVQIQARGTLGGNLATASPAGDGVAALAAYDASVVVQSVRGERTIAFADLQTGYKKSTRAADEVIVAVQIELPPPDAVTLWRKVGTRRAQAISKVALAAVALVEGQRLTRLGLGMASVAAVTATLPSVRAYGLATPLPSISNADLDAAVDADITPIDDIRSTGEYRKHVAKALIRGFFDGLRGAA